MKARGSVWVKVTGALIFVVCLYYVVASIRKHWDTFASLTFSGSDWLVFALTSVLYALMLSLQGIGFAYVLRAIGGVMPLRISAGATMATQIGRYIPSGVMHFVGRHYLLAQRGSGHGLLVKAASVDIVLTCLVSLSLAIALGVFTFPAGLSRDFATRLTGIVDLSNWVLLLAGGLLLVLALVGSRIYLKKQHIQKFSALSLRLKRPAAAYLLFFVLQASMFLVLYTTVGGTPPPSLAALFIFSWLVGYVTVGSPGGLGVREAALVFLGSGIAPQESILLAALLFRVVTVIGDLIGYAIGVYLLRSDPAGPAGVGSRS